MALGQNLVEIAASGFDAWVAANPNIEIKSVLPGSTGTNVRIWYTGLYVPTTRTQLDKPYTGVGTVGNQ